MRRRFVQHKNLLWTVAVLALVFGSLTRCDSLEESTAGARGTLQLYLTDAPFPFDLVDSANVTITRVDLVPAGDSSAIRTVSETTRTFNLLDLRGGVTALLADTTLEAGTYAQLRLIVREAAVVLKDGRRFDLQVPSGAQTGIKVLLDGFVIGADSLSTLTLDFDVSESFVVQGNPDTPAGIHGFLFKPVVRPLSTGVPEAG
ncbi:MAG: hypothetical protein KatS3mg043_1241 [Rhodothermaceae bacterium]|nr:MAG: hypothetical protein KatS3mg043_1241 [Rhodothermaceae bacterium]